MIVLKEKKRKKEKFHLLSSFDSRSQTQASHAAPQHKGNANLEFLGRKPPRSPSANPPPLPGCLRSVGYLGRVARDRDPEEEHGRAHPGHHGEQQRVPRVPVARQTDL